MFRTKIFNTIILAWLIILVVGCTQEQKQSIKIDQSRANTQSVNPSGIRIEREDLLNRALRGCDWLTDISQVLDIADSSYGAMKGEYDTKNRKWSFYGPFWHTGQAVRTLLLTYNMTGKEKYLKHAILGGEYMIRYQTMDKEDKKFCGFIHGKESKGANTAS